MPHLKILSIHLARTIENDELNRLQAHRYRHALPTNGVWRHLVDFTLKGVTIGGIELFKLLTANMPNLRCLKLGKIELTDWTWDGVFEGLKMMSRLIWLDLSKRPNSLRHEGGESYPIAQPNEAYGRSGLEARIFLDMIEIYVVKGGRQPSLPPEAEPEDAQIYFKEYDDTQTDYTLREKLARYKRVWNLPESGHLKLSDRNLAIATVLASST